MSNPLTWQRGCDNKDTEGGFWKIFRGLGLRRRARKTKGKGGRKNEEND
jgi:hypothetical protein